jgi:hypothetical protein
METAIHPESIRPDIYMSTSTSQLKKILRTAEGAMETRIDIAECSRECIKHLRKNIRGSPKGDSDR